MVKTPNEWLTGVATKIGADVNLDSVANKLGENVSAKNLLDYVSIYTGMVIKGLSKEVVVDKVRGKRKGVSTSVVNAALKEQNIPEELLLPVVKRGRTKNPTVMPSDMDLFAMFDTDLDNDSVN
jgi:hypothetical protein